LGPWLWPVAVPGRQDALRRAGFDEAVLWVLETNVRARRFYEIAGWKPDGQTKADERGTVTLHEVRYRFSFGR